jgi:hypothetical protein
MPVTFVTAFLDLHEDRSGDKSVETCFGHFQKLVGSGIPIHAFVSACYLDRVPVAPNLTVETLELEDLETWQSVQDLSYSVPPTNAPHHDTANFMTLINAKVEMIQRAPKGASHYAWIDFSIFHVIRDEERAIDTLRRLATAHLPANYMACPGCWSKNTALQSLFSSVNWRFCGGLLIGDAASLCRLYELYQTHYARIVKEQGRLVWEVNLWTYFENIGVDFGWYRADHNDSILAAPIPKRIVASLTTIPPRFALCRKTLDSLIPQVDRIYLSIPETYSRFPGPVTLPEFLEEPGYAKVEVLRSPDFGPATKYLGALGQISEDHWIFVCDDDQEYHPELISRMSAALKDPGAYQNHYRQIQRKTSGGMIHGYVGVIFHASCLKALPEFPLPHAARFVDDQWMSAYCFKEGIEISPTPAEMYPEIFRTLQDGHELYAPEALAFLHNREQMVKELEQALGVRFEGASVTY